MELQNQFESAGIVKKDISIKIKDYFKKYDLHNWVGLLGLFIFTVTMGFTINSFVKTLSTPGAGWKIFFGMFDRFTYQSNWLLFIYMVFYLIKPNHQFFKGNKLLVSVMVYIFFTFIGYNVVLVGISGDRAYVGNATDVTSNAWLHIIAPLYFIFFGLTAMYCKPNQEPQSLIKTILKGMIYPTFYALYLLTIPFVFADYRNNPELYGNTGIAPDGTPLAYSVYGKSTNTFNYPTSYAYIFVMYLIFFPSSYCLFYFSWKGLNKLNARNR